MIYKRETDIKNATELALMQHETNTIGVLSEKTLHRVLKFYFCEDESKHEIKYKGYVADVFIEREGMKPLIVEIQTKQVFKLAQKLSAYGDDAEIIVVLPVIAQKRLMWISTEDGSIKAGGKTSRPKTVYHAMSALYGIRDYINKENICIAIPLISATEYKRLDGRDSTKKRGATKVDIVPDALLDIVYINCREDYERLLPESFSKVFTASEFAKSVSLSVDDARQALLVFFEAGIIEECGKDGRRKLWKKCDHIAE